jgi:hypothetical protein
MHSFGFDLGGQALIIPDNRHKTWVGNFVFYIRRASKTEWMKQCGAKIDCPNCQPAPIPLA